MYKIKKLEWEEKEIGVKTGLDACIVNTILGNIHVKSTLSR